MLTVEEAEQTILNHLPQWEIKTVGVSDAIGCILQETIIASRAQPPFDRVTMDGIAIASNDYQCGQRRFHLQGIQLAGEVRKILKRGQCLQVTTGAVLPAGADCIIPIEQTVFHESDVVVINERLKEGQFVHSQASDYPEGHTLLTPGTRIGPSELGCILASGVTHLKVAYDPRIAIVTTGNELVKVGQAIEKHQIYSTNDAVLAALLKQYGYSNTACYHANDSIENLSDVLSSVLQQADMLIVTGGVSMGQTDFVPLVLNQLGIEKLFHKVSQCPGKPMWVGRNDNQMIFGLPGNPVSAYVCLRRYVIPALQSIQHAKTIKITRVYLADSISLPTPLTYFVPIISQQDHEGRIQAMLKRTNTSGDFFSLVGTDGMVELPAGITDFHKGSEVKFYSWR